MKALPTLISMTLCGLILGFAPHGVAESAQTCAPAAAGYPSFCSIPRPPNDVRTPAQFRAAVEAQRQAAHALVADTGPASWTLPAGAEPTFAAQLRAEAAPPPPLTSPQDSGADFARRAREAATPPPKASHPQ